MLRNLQKEDDDVELSSLSGVVATKEEHETQIS